MAAPLIIGTIPVVVVIGRLVYSAPEFFGSGLEEAKPELELILRLFRAADINADWRLSVVEFHTLLVVIMRESKIHHFSIHDSEKILRRLDQWGSLEIAAEQWLALCTMDTEGVEEDDELPIPNCDCIDEQLITKKVFDYLDSDGEGRIEVADYQKLLALLGFDASMPDPGGGGGAGGGALGGGSDTKDKDKDKDKGKDKDKDKGKDKGKADPSATGGTGGGSAKEGEKGGGGGESKKGAVDKINVLRDPNLDTLLLLAPTVDFDEFYDVLVLNDFPERESDEGGGGGGRGSDEARRWRKKRGDKARKCCCSVS